jgi:hypothetical protein
MALEATKLRDMAQARAEGYQVWATLKDLVLSIGVVDGPLQHAVHMGLSAQHADLSDEEMTNRVIAPLMTMLNRDMATAKAEAMQSTPPQEAA